MLNNHLAELYNKKNKKWKLLVIIVRESDISQEIVPLEQKVEIEEVSEVVEDSHVAAQASVAVAGTRDLQLTIILIKQTDVSICVKTNFFIVQDSDPVAVKIRGLPYQVRFE